MAEEGESSLTEQKEELIALQSMYPECHLLSDNNGCYSNKVQITLQEHKMTMVFSLKATYPDSCPRIEITVTPDNMVSENDLQELYAELYDLAKEKMGSAMLYTLVQHANDWVAGRPQLDETVTMATKEEDEQVECQFYLKGKCRFGDKCRNLHSDATKDDVKSVKESVDETKENEKKMKKEKKQDADDEICKKKPPMKTAEDVISRILWDKSVPSKCFTVGYLDRFTGIVENAFDTFDWTNDLASLDHTVLAIPQHRIQYFKYKDVIVWDKNTRLDNVFGSTGGGVTILDVITKYKKLKVDDDDNDDNDDNDDDDDVGDHYDNNDDYNDMEKSTDEIMNTESDCSKSVKPAKGKRDNPNRPNYFVALRVTNDDIITAVKTIQDAIVEAEPRLAKCCIPVAKLHLTLCTLRIDTEHQLRSACRALRDMKDELSRLLPPTTLLKFEELRVFNDRVLYAAPNPEPALARFNNSMLSHFKADDINLAGNRDKFEPHMTLMKLTRSSSKKLKTIDESLYYKFLDNDLGTQPIESIHLCSMTDGVRHDGFYHTALSVDLFSED